MAVNFYLDKRTDKNGDCPIRVSIALGGVRLLTSSGYSIAPAKWDSTRQEVRKGCSSGKGIAYNVINAHIKRIAGYFIDFENQTILSGRTLTKEDLHKEYITTFGENNQPETATGIRAKTFFDYLDEFTAEMGNANQWTKATYQKFAALKNHLTGFAPDLSFEQLDEKGLSNFVDYLRDTLDMRNSTIGKQLGFLKWFLRWASNKGYNIEKAYNTFAPKLKISEKKVIFLEWDELMTVYSFVVPDNGSTIKLKDSNGCEYEKTVHDAGALKKVRDVFCFCCFTSLRYSDVANLRRSDVFDNYISITTIKTADSLKIELNDYSKEILSRYEDEIFIGNLALPVISNQKMNDYLKELTELCGLNKPITVTHYKGNKRIDEVFPKYALLGTHCGRRTFICNALMLGVAPQIVMKWTGHSDYKAMKPYIDIADKAKQDAMKVFNKK